MARTLRINSRGVADVQVDLDGHDISHALRGLTLRMDVGEIPQLTLDALVIDMSNAIDGVAALIPEETRDLLVKLGWTPPEDP